MLRIFFRSTKLRPRTSLRCFLLFSAVVPALVAAFVLLPCHAQELPISNTFLTYPGTAGLPGAGKRIVMITAD